MTIKQYSIVLLTAAFWALGLSCVTFSQQNAEEASKQISFSWSDGTARLISSRGYAPRICRLADGRILAGIETGGGIKTLASADNGKTWTAPVQASFRPDKRCANVNFYRDGNTLYLAYRAIGNEPKGFYTSLQVSVSQDEGQSWTHHSTVAEYTESRGGIWEPYLGTLNGKLTCFYANDAASVTKSSYQNIEYKVWDGSQWTNRTVVSDGNKHRSRDGMPVWTQLKSGEYVCIIEGTQKAKDGFPFVINLIYSTDGKSWSEPVEIYRPTTKSSKASAPGVVELPNGQLVVSFQTDEDSSVKGDRTSVMKTILSDGTDVKNLSRSSFTPSQSVFGSQDVNSVWSGISFFDGTLYAAAGTRYGANMKFIELPVQSFTMR